MRRTFLAILTVMVACAPREPSPPTVRTQDARTDTVPAIGKLREAKLKNGLPVYFLDRASRAVEVHVVWEVGSANDPKGAAGLAGVTFGAMDEEIGGRSVQETQHYLGELGVKLEPMIAWRGAHLRLVFPREKQTEALDVLQQVLRKPGFSQTALERVKAQRVGFLEGVSSNIAERGVAAGVRVLLGADTREASPILGNLVEVPSIQLAQVQAFHVGCFVPAKAKIFVIGGLDQEALLAALNERLGDWTAADVQCPPATTIDKPSLTKDAIVLVDSPDSKRAAVVVLRYQNVTGSSVALDATIAILGQTGRRLERSLADKGGLAYDPIVSMQPYPAGRIITIAFATEVVQVAEAISLVEDVERSFTETGPSSDELAGVKKQLRGQVLHDAEALENLAIDPGVPAVWYRRLSDIDALGATSVSKAWAEVQSSPRVLVVYGPADALRPVLEKLGPVTVVKE